MKSKAIFFWIILMGLMCSCKINKVDYSGQLNHVVIGLGPFAQVTKNCSMSSENYDYWYVFNSDSTFWCFSSNLTRYRFLYGKYLVSRDKVVLNFNPEVVRIKEVQVSEGPPKKEIYNAFEEIANQTYWIKKCGVKIVFSDEDGTDLGIQIPDSYDKKIQFLENEKLIGKEVIRVTKN